MLEKRPSLLSSEPVTPSFWHRKVKELELLKSFIDDTKSRNSIKYKKGDIRSLIQAKLRCRDAIHASVKPGALWSESRLDLGKQTSIQFQGMRISYNYQRNGLEILAPSSAYSAVYPLLPRRNWQSRARFTTSCQAASSAFFETLRGISPRTRFYFPADPYWETLQLVERYGMHYAQSYPENKPGKSELRVLYFDSSTELPRNPFSMAKAKGPIQLFVIDTSCFSHGSKRLSDLIDAAIKRGIPCVLLRSHMKLDSLAIEYSRLGSIALIWGSAFPKKTNDFCMKLWSEYVYTSRLMGSFASLRQLFPFYGSGRFHKLNNLRVECVRKSNHGVFADVRKGHERKFRSNIKIQSFAHDLFFVIVLRTTLTEPQFKEVMSRLEYLCDWVDVPYAYVSSYGWDLLGVTYFPAYAGFFPEKKENSVFRMSVPDLDQKRWKPLAEAILQWVEYVEEVMSR